MSLLCPDGLDAPSLCFLSWFWLFLPLPLLYGRPVPHSLIYILPPANKSFFQKEVVGSTCISRTWVRGRVVSSSPAPPISYVHVHTPLVIIGVWVLFEMSEVGWEVALVNFLSPVRLTDLKTLIQLHALSMYCLQGQTWVGQPGDKKREIHRDTEIGRVSLFGLSAGDTMAPWKSIVFTV